MKKYVICDSEAITFWGYGFDTYEEAQNALRDGLEHGPACVQSMQIVEWSDVKTLCEE